MAKATNKKVSSARVRVFGIPNCNTVKKALDFFKSQGVSIEFHDFKKQGVSPDLLEDWAKQHAWENLLNKKGTTWRGLSAEEQQAALHWQGAVALMQQKPSVIKRPVTHWPNGAITIGFDEAIFSSNI